MVRFPPSSQPWRRWLAVVLVGLMVLVAACSGKTDAEDMPAATLDRGGPSSTVVPQASTTSTTEPELTPEEEVEAAYHEANDVLSVLLADPEQSLARLEETRTGDSFDLVRELVERRRDDGEWSDYPTGFPVAEVLDVQRDGSLAVLIACEPNDAVLRAKDGSVINDDVVARRTEVDMEHLDGRWKISAEYELERFPEARTCDG